MVKKSVKKNPTKMHFLHLLFLLILCVLLVIIFSMKSADNESLADSIIFADASLVDLEETQDIKIITLLSENHTSEEIASHKLSVTIKNNATVVADCYMILTLQNETYKNATVVDIPVIDEGEEVISDILFEMPTGNSTFSLDKFC